MEKTTLTTVPDEDFLRLDNQICFSLHAASRAFNGVYRDALKDLNLTYPQYLVMLVLWEEDGPMVSELGERLYLDSGTLTPLLKRLEAAGLIARVRDTQDERRVHITLTAAGRKLRARAQKIPGCVRTASRCSLGELMQLKQQLRGLRDRLAA
jgi:MarR family transcriptional regulator, organic hydroperoxide resistance regulator